MESENKIEILIGYFKNRKEGYEIASSTDFNNRNVKFRFCKDKEIKIFEISREVMDDLTAEQIIQKLEKENWESVLDKPNKEILTHVGFRTLD
jgi:hypothetical protein